MDGTLENTQLRPEDPIQSGQERVAEIFKTNLIVRSNRKLEQARSIEKALQAMVEKHAVIKSYSIDIDTSTISLTFTEETYASIYTSLIEESDVYSAKYFPLIAAANESEENRSEKISEVLPALQEILNEESESKPRLQESGGFVLLSLFYQLYDAIGRYPNVAGLSHTNPAFHGFKLFMLKNHAHYDHFGILNTLLESEKNSDILANVLEEINHLSDEKRTKCESKLSFTAKTALERLREGVN